MIDLYGIRLIGTDIWWSQEGWAKKHKRIVDREFNLPDVITDIHGEKATKECLGHRYYVYQVKDSQTVANIDWVEDLRVVFVKGKKTEVIMETKAYTETGWKKAARKAWGDRRVWNTGVVKFEVWSRGSKVHEGTL